MGDNIFGDCIDEKSLRKAHNSLYDPRKEKEEMSRKIKEILPQLEQLIGLSQKTNFAIGKAKDKRELESIKDEFDKVAFVLNKFSQDFKKPYEEILAMYIAEKLEGTFDKPIKYSKPIGNTTSSQLPKTMQYHSDNTTYTDEDFF